ncbi:MAG: peptidoglycan-binding protein [Bacteroidetes bacterium]|nr:peptidoglycan-binding protein [Bacteroidota bacterium]
MADETVIKYMPAKRRKPKAAPNKVWPWVVGGAAVAVGGYLLWRNLRASPKEAVSPPAGGGESPLMPMPQVAAAGDALPLRQGSSGPRVQQLQQLLTQAGFDPKGIDGQFGPNTQAAVLAFQRAKGLAADGVVGELTWSALTAQSGASAATGASASLAQQLFTAWVQGDSAAALSRLKLIPNAESYRSTSTEFGKLSESATFVTRTLVTALAERFGSLSVWPQMQDEFRRMGLVYRDGKWAFPSLSGPETSLLVTRAQTPVMFLDAAGLHTARTVSPNTPLGDYVDTWQWKGYTLLRFRTSDGKFRYVAQSHTRFAA